MENKWADIVRDWARFKGKAQEEWGELTENELTQVNGNRNALANLIQTRYFVTKKTAHTQIQTWMDQLKE